jgi:hypothetical protein
MGEGGREGEVCGMGIGDGERVDFAREQIQRMGLGWGVLSSFSESRSEDDWGLGLTF